MVRNWFDLQKVFDWFDDAASRVLRIAYLIPFVSATATYFGGDPLAWILAFAVEMQTYSSVRKLAVIWNGLKAPALEDYQREQMKKEMWAQIATVVVLAMFSVWNQMSYLAEHWHPETSAFGAPLWLDIIIRAAGPAVFFFLTAFAAPFAKTMGEKIADESHKMLEAFLGVLKNQRNRAIKEIDGKMVDMSEAITTVAAAANEKKSGAILASIQSTITRLATGESAPQTPALPAPRASRRGSSLLDLSREHYRLGMTPHELADRTGTSTKTAGRHIKLFQQEALEREEAPFMLPRKRA